MKKYLVLLLLVVFVYLSLSAPVDPKKKDEKKDGKKKEGDGEIDDMGLEYGRYLQQVVQALEEDKEFAEKLKNISVEEIESGKIADQLEFVKHNVRTKLDELKRIEIDRLRKLVQERMEQTELGLYRDDDGHLLPSPDGRRWRTIHGHRSGQEGGGGDSWLGLDRKGVKIPVHLDIDNMHTFEISDFKKLIQAATKDLEELDKKRREEFKKYEMEKELKYRDSLKNMTEEERKKTEQQHEEMVKKHKDHPKVHHPGSKPQLEQVWEEEDHMPKDEFNPRTFFAMHDINGDGHLDEKEVEALLMPEIRKMYDPKNEEDDPAEMEEEYHRMREHIFNETDKDKDGLLSLDEFIKMTQQQDFEQDEGWKGLDEQTVYSRDELEEYMRQQHMMNQQYGGDPRMYYDVPHAPNQGMPPNINYHMPQPNMQAAYPQYQQQVHPGMHPPQQQPYHQPAYGQHQDPSQYQAVPPHQQAQFHGGQPQNYQGVPVHQQPQAIPAGLSPQQQQQQHVPQGHPQQQFVPQGHQQQFVPQQQTQQGYAQHQQVQPGSPQHQQVPQGHPQQQQVPQGHPQQHIGNVPQQQPVGNVPPHYQGQASQVQQHAPDQKQVNQEQLHVAQKQAPSTLNEIPNPPVQKVAQSGQQQQQQQKA